MAGSITKELIDLSVADATTGWAGTSGQLDTEVFKQGTGSYTYQTPKNGVGSGTFTPAANVNMTANYTVPHLYWTMRCDVFPFCEILNTGATNSGLMLKVTDGSGNFVQWHIAGKDTWDGSWRNFILDLTNTSNVHSSSGTLSLADVDIIEFLTDNSNSGQIRIIDNTWLDALRYGEGLQANSTTTEAFGFVDLAIDDKLTANYYGALQETDGVLFCQAKLTLGDLGDTNSTNFVSNNETVYFLDRIVDTALYGVVGVEATAATNVSDFAIDGLVMKSVGAQGAEFDFSDTDINSFSLTGSTLLDMGTINFAVGSVGTSKFSGCGASILQSTFTATDSTWIDSGQITQNSATIDSCLVDSSSATSALLATDLDKVPGCTFISAGTGHATELNTVGDGTMAWSNIVTGYAVGDGSTGDEALYVNVASGTLTLNIASGFSAPSIRTAGATVIVVANTVTLEYTLLDKDTKAAIEGVAITVKAATGGSMPFEASVTITRVGNDAVVAHTGHGFSTGQKVWIDGADQNDYNRIKTITVNDANEYQYPVEGTPTSPATGTITSTAIVVDGLTDATGKISDTRTYLSNQPIAGDARKGSAAPVYATSPISDTVSSSTGLSVTILMIPD